MHVAARLPRCSVFTVVATPLFPKPSRQLIEGLGWGRPARTFSSSCCHAAKSQTSQSAQSPKPTRQARQTKHAATISQAQTKATERLEILLADAIKILESPTPPKEEEILKSLKTCEELANYFKNTKLPSSLEEGRTRPGSKTPVNQLSFLDESDPESEALIAAAIQDGANERISATAYKIIKDSKVFLTGPVLNAYVNTQSLLNRPESFAEVFSLYANKPVPLEGSNPIQYSPAKPNKASSAVPPGTAQTALEAAIHAKILPLCLDIITATVCTPAFYRAKFVRRALLPVTAFTVAPAAAYATATQLAPLQETMSSEMATNIAFAGILSYVAFTGTIGYVALTTANDQMDRVTWAGGMPLRQRWLREEERAMLDKVASAWGFRESWRKGEEVGQEWEALKELIGLRGMVLDKVELMEGME